MRNWPRLSRGYAAAKAFSLLYIFSIQRDLVTHFIADSIVIIKNVFPSSLFSLVVRTLPSLPGWRRLIKQSWRCINPVVHQEVQCRLTQSVSVQKLICFGLCDIGGSICF